MKEIKFNTNHDVKVKLTDYGRDILRKQHQEFLKQWPSAKGLVEDGLPKEDSDGWSTWQLWSLMSELGEYLYLGGKLPFETNIIILVDN